MNKKFLWSMCIAGTLLILTQSIALADWTPTTGGTYDYATTANWTSGISNNVFLSSTYGSGDQVVRINSDEEWNSTDKVITAQTNDSSLLLRAGGANRNIELGGGVKNVNSGSTMSADIQFGTINANENINFILSSILPIEVDSAAASTTRAIFNGILSGSGGLFKSGNGDVYLQNAANTFSGQLKITGGQVILAGADATLATTNIVVGHQDAIFGYTAANAGSQGILMMDNNRATVGTSSGSAGFNGNRIPDDATVELQGGGLRLNANPGDGTGITETIGTVNLTRGMSDLVVWQASSGPNNITELHINSLNRSPGATLGGFGHVWNGGGGTGTLGTGAALESRITFDQIDGASPSSQVINGIIPWALNGAQRCSSYTWSSAPPLNFLTYDDSYGLTPQTTYASDINSAAANENVKMTATDTLATNKTINSLTLYSAGLSGTDETLTLNSGALNYTSSNPAGGGNSVVPNVDFNGQAGFIFIIGGGKLQMSGNLVNIGAEGLTVSGYGSNNNRDRSELYLTGQSTYTGPTTINGVYLQAVAQPDTDWCIPEDTAVTINEGGALYTSWKDITIGSLAGVGYVELDHNKVMTLGGDNSSTTYGGNIKEEANTECGLIKTGTGTFTLSSTNTYSGNTTVSGGGLVVDGTLTDASGSVTVSSGTFLAGAGTIGRDVTVNNGGLLAAGLTNSIGTLNISSNLTLSASSTLDIQLAGAGSGDSIVVGGTVDISGSTLDLSAIDELHGNETYTIIDNQSSSATVGTFANDGDLSLSDGSETFSIVYNGGTGNDVVITVLPRGTVILVK